MSKYRVVSCVVGRGCFLWLVCSLVKTLLAFALLHFVLQGHTCILLQVFHDFLLLHSSPVMKRTYFLVLDQTILPASWEIFMQVRKKQLELDMEQQTGSKLEKEYVKAIYCHPAYLTYTQSTSYKMPDSMKHKLESRLRGEISITSDMQNPPPLWQKAKRN